MLTRRCFNSARSLVVRLMPLSIVHYDNNHYTDLRWLRAAGFHKEQKTNFVLTLPDSLVHMTGSWFSVQQSATCNYVTSNPISQSFCSQHFSSQEKREAGQELNEWMDGFASFVEWIIISFNRNLIQLRCHSNTTKGKKCISFSLPSDKKEEGTERTLFELCYLFSWDALIKQSLKFLFIAS